MSKLLSLVIVFVALASVGDAKVSQKITNLQRLSSPKVAMKTQSIATSLYELENIRWVGGWGKALTGAFPSTPVAYGLTEYQLLGPAYGLGGVYANGLADQTIRQIAHLTSSGSQIRLRFQNQYSGQSTSTSVLTINQVNVAQQFAGQEIVASTNTLVTFNGETSVNLFPGEGIISDPVEFYVTKGDNIAISMYFAGASGPPPLQVLGQQTGYVSLETGNLNGATTFTVDSGNVTTGPLWLSGVDVLCESAATTIAFLGDSITSGFHSTLNANTDFPNQFANRLTGPEWHSFGVINEGIIGNAVTTGGYDGGLGLSVLGQAAVERVYKDILGQSQVKYMIWLEGINDILNGASSVDNIIAGLEHGVRQVRASKPTIQIFGATLTPAGGTVDYTAAMETQRQAVNTWIRTTIIFDAVIDFDAAIRDPANPEIITPAWDSGDHLHPNDAGYLVMANAIPLLLFL